MPGGARIRAPGMTVLRTLCCAAALALTATGAPSPVQASDLPIVVVSIPPQKFIVEELAGDRVEVEVMLPPGASPATYEPTPRQLASLNVAALYFQIGAPFEQAVLSRISTLMPDLAVVDCRSGITLEPMESHGDGHGHGPLDPHIWLDPIRMKTVATTTAASLRERLPAAAGAIDSSLQRLLENIDATDRRIEAKLKPFAGRDLVVFHPAYGYFARRYGLVQVPVEAEGKAPTARRLAEIVDSLRGRKTAAIFVQPQFSRTAAQRVADALACDLVELDPLAERYLSNLETMASRIASVMVK